MDFFYYFDVRLVSEIKIVEENYRFYSLQIPLDFKGIYRIPHARTRPGPAKRDLWSGQNTPSPMVT